MADPTTPTYYVAMRKERRRAEQTERRVERAEENAAAYRARWADERARAERAAAESTRLRTVTGLLRQARERNPRRPDLVEQAVDVLLAALGTADDPAPDWEARAVAAETALAATREALSAFGLHDDHEDTLLTYEHSDGEVCIVAEVICAPALETLEALLDVPDQPNPDGPVWAVCGYCGGNIFRHYDWSHEQGTPPQGHDATPLLDVPDQPNPTPENA